MRGEKKEEKERQKGKGKDVKRAEVGEERKENERKEREKRREGKARVIQVCSTGVTGRYDGQVTMTDAAAPASRTDGLIGQTDRRAE